MSNYKKDDLVQVVDGSWSLTIQDGQLRHSYGVELRDRDFEILYTDLKLPSSNSDRFNEIIIKAKDNGQIVFIMERMVKPKQKETIPENNNYTVMKKFDVNKHWDDFINNKLVVNCETEELANEFLKYCHKKGLRWRSNLSLLNKNNWNEYKENTCYDKDGNGFGVGRILYFKENKKQVFKFLGLKQTPTKENIEVIYHNNETIVLIKGDKKYYRGISKCNPEDTYNREYGFLLAYQRARAKELGI